MRVAVVSTNVSCRRLRPGWASDLAAAISRRTEKMERRDMMARLVRSMRRWGRCLAEVSAMSDAATEKMRRLRTAWRAR